MKAFKKLKKQSREFVKILKSRGHETLKSIRNYNKQFKNSTSRYINKINKNVDYKVKRIEKENKINELLEKADEQRKEIKLKNDKKLKSASKFFTNVCKQYDDIMKKIKMHQAENEKKKKEKKAEKLKLKKQQEIEKEIQIERKKDEKKRQKLNQEIFESKEKVKEIEDRENKKEEKDKEKVKVIKVDFTKEKVKPRTKKKVSFNEDSFVIFAFVIIVFALLVNFFNPYYTNTSSLAVSNQTDTETIENPVEKVKTEVENRIIRSFPFYDDILKGYFGMTLLMNESKYKNANDDQLFLINTKRNIYTNKDKTNFIIRYDLDDEDGKKQIDSRIETFNTIYEKLKEKGVDLSIYTVNGIWTSEAILNFDVDEKEPLKYVDMFAEGLNKNIKFDYLKIIDFTTFKEYFFKTDHHWTMKGAYQGYKDVAKMYGIDESELVPADFYKVDGIKFIGSNARACAYDKVFDEIYDIKFDKKYKTRLNGKIVKPSELSEKEKYLSGEFDKEEFYNHYGKYFRPDTGEIVYTFDENKGKRNIVILADSFSNCIEQVIASHFYNTYVIDLRYYEYYMHETFNLYKYVEENDIDDVLFFYSANCIYFDSMEFKVE